MTSKLIKYKLLLLLVVGFSFPAQSAVISFDPSNSSVDLNEAFDIDLRISDLGDDFISGFDLNISFDDSILAFAGFSFEEPDLFGATNLDVWGFASNIQFTTNFGGGLVNLFELSFDFNSDLDFLQANDFLLGTLSFIGIGEGTSSLDASASPFGVGLAGGNTSDLSDGTLGEFDAVEIAMETQSASVSVPEPGIAILFAIGLLGFGIQRKLKATSAA